MSLFRARKPGRVGRMPGGSSETTAHSSRICSKTRVLPFGYHSSRPPAMTATVGAPAARAPLWAAMSMP